MVSTTINVSGLLCLFLALGPANILAAPHFPGLQGPDMMEHTEPTNENGNSDSFSGEGVHVGIPGGPSVNAGGGSVSSHRGPCGPGSGSTHAAGEGVNAGIPGGPFVNAGHGHFDHEDSYPCPEPAPAPVVVETTAPAPATWTPAPAPIIVPTNAPAPAPAPAPIVPAPTYTTPIYIPHSTPVWGPAVPIVKPSAPLIPRPAPSASASPSPSAMPAYNAGSSLAPASVLAVAVPVIMAFFH